MHKNIRTCFIVEIELANISIKHSILELYVFINRVERLNLNSLILVPKKVNIKDIWRPKVILKGYETNKK